MLSPKESLSGKGSAPPLRTRRLCGELFFGWNSPPRRRVRRGYAEKTLFPTESKGVHYRTIFPGVLTEYCPPGL